MVLMHLHIALVLRELAKFLGNGRVMSAVLALVLHTEYSGSGMQMRKLGKLWWIEASRLSTMPSLLPLPSLSVRSGGFTRGGGGLSFLCVPWGCPANAVFQKVETEAREKRRFLTFASTEYGVGAVDGAIMMVMHAFVTRHNLVRRLVPR